MTDNPIPARLSVKMKEADTAMYFQIQCSSCGHRSRKLPYDVDKTSEQIIKTGWNSFGSAFYCPECSKGRPTWDQEHTRDLIFRRMVHELTEAIAYRSGTMKREE